MKPGNGKFKLVLFVSYDFLKKANALSAFWGLSLTELFERFVDRSLEETAQAQTLKK